MLTLPMVVCLSVIFSAHDVNKLIKWHIAIHTVWFQYPLNIFPVIVFYLVQISTHQSGIRISHKSKVEISSCKTHARNMLSLVVLVRFSHKILQQRPCGYLWYEMTNKLVLP